MSDTSRLSVLEIAALALIVLVWGVNNAAAMVGTQVLPPLLMGALRFGVAGVFLIPFVRPPFPNPKSLLLLVLFGGPIHYGLVYLAFAMAHDLSPIAVSLQLWIPLTVLFGWWVLKERPSGPAVAGLVVSFAGVAVMTADARALRDWDAILVGLAASAAWALCTVLARRTTSTPPLKMQGLLALGTAPTLGIATFVFEPDPIGAMARADALIWACVLWAGLASSLFATALLFWLIQRREAGRVTPYLLATPVVSGAIGVAFMGDVLTAQIVAGAVMTIGGVALVALAEAGLKRRSARAQAVAADAGA